MATKVILWICVLNHVTVTCLHSLIMWQSHGCIRHPTMLQKRNLQIALLSARTRSCKKKFVGQWRTITFGRFLRSSSICCIDYPCCFATNAVILNSLPDCVCIIIYIHIYYKTQCVTVHMVVSIPVCWNKMDCSCKQCKQNMYKE